jgi:hypothetical protein
MIEIGYKFKSNTGVNVTIYEKLTTWGSYLAELRLVNDKGRIIRQGAKIINIENIKNKDVDFEEDYIKKYTDLMRKEVKSKK